MSKRSNPLLLTISVLARFGVAALLIGIGLLIFGLLQSSKIEPEPVAQGESAVRVTAIRAPRMVVPREIEGFGTARAMDAVVVSAQVSARVVERPAAVEAGSDIAEGDLIVRLESTDFESRVESGRQRIAAVRAQLAALEAERVQLENQVRLGEEEVEINRRDLSRIEKAVEGGSGTQADLDLRLAEVRRSERSVEALRQALVQFGPRAEQLEAELGTLRATLAIDEQDLARTRITSPISGRVQSCEVEVGELPAVGTRIARIVNTDRVEVPLRVPVSSASRISIGDDAELRGDGAEAARWAGTVTRIAPESDPATRTLTVFVEVENAGRERPLLPGRFVMGRVRVVDAEARVLVPRRAVLGDRVLVASANSPTRVQPVDVLVSRHVEMEVPGGEPGERQWAVVEQGLEPGAVVITSNLDELIGGMLVEPAVAGEEE